MPRGGGDTSASEACKGALARHENRHGNDRSPRTTGIANDQRQRAGARLNVGQTKRDIDCSLSDMKSSL